MSACFTIAQELVAPKKGILAADESTTTIGKHFQKIAVANTEENRRAYRELLCTTPGIEAYISGVILYDETIRQSTADGRPFVDVLRDKGIHVGIKVDEGTMPLDAGSEETITKGLDGLPERLHAYRDMGATFAKWRGVYRIGADTPSSQAMQENASALAAYAKACQDADIVPIVEPEVLMDGNHTIVQCFDITTRVLTAVFVALEAAGVSPEGMLLKPNMVLAGQDAGSQTAASEVAEMTLRCLTAVVPQEVPGIVFLSGGQSEAAACEHLALMNASADHAPWQLSFSYGRALQTSALEAWHGEPGQVAQAQKAFLHRAKLASAAREGTYTADME